jgi:hypothetical protein
MAAESVPGIPLIPLLDPRRPDQAGAYETALDRLGKAARHVDVRGRGAVAEGAGTHSRGFSPVRRTTGDEQDRAADKG